MNTTQETSTSSLGEPHVNRSQSQDYAKDLKIHEETLPLSLSEYLQTSDLDGLSGRMYPAFYQVDKDGISLASSQRLKKSGMAFAGECLTLNSSEFPSAAEESLLSDILETGGHLTEFSLSPKACEGILRRAEKRGKKIPEVLEKALKAQAHSRPSQEPA